MFTVSAAVTKPDIYGYGQRHEQHRGHLVDQPGFGRLGEFCDDGSLRCSKYCPDYPKCYNNCHKHGRSLKDRDSTDHTSPGNHGLPRPLHCQPGALRHTALHGDGFGKQQYCGDLVDQPAGRYDLLSGSVYGPIKYSDVADGYCDGPNRRRPDQIGQRGCFPADYASREPMEHRLLSTLRLLRYAASRFRYPMEGANPYN